MKKRLRMSRKLFFALMVCVEALCILFAVAFYAYNVNTLKTAEKARLASLCSDATARVDNMVRAMDELSVGVTIADGFIPAMRLLYANADPDSYVPIIRSIMVKAYVSKTEIYRVIVLSENGNAVSLGRNELSKAEIRTLAADGYWHQTDRRANSKVLEGPMLDPWVKHEPQQIFSLLRAVRDGEKILGYIEVQMQTSRLADIFLEKQRYGDLYYALIDANNSSMFFSNFGDEQRERYLDTIIGKAAWYPTDSIETSGGLISICGSNYTEWKTAMLMPDEMLLAPLRHFLPLALMASLAMGTAIVVFFKFIVDRVTRPVDRVVSKISKIELVSLDEPFERVTGSYESEVLSDAFEAMKLRLLESIKREKAIERMQTRVLLESLQSRIGPHFLNNTLGSIANMCESGDAQGAAEACFSLSELLRYSAVQGSDLVTIREELEHLSNYLLLMKGRYRHRLEFSIDAAEQCMDVKLLKLTIQPLVENAIKYSLSESEQVRVEISIAREEDEVVVRVQDNGSGFDAPMLRALDDSIAQFLRTPSQASLYEMMPRRGMGLVGTLMRLYLLLGEQHFCYHIGNSDDGGALIELRITADER